MILDHDHISTNLRHRCTVIRLFFASQRSHSYTPTPHKTSFVGTPNLSQENSRLTRASMPRTLGEVWS